VGDISSSNDETITSMSSFSVSSRKDNFGDRDGEYFSFSEDNRDGDFDVEYGSGYDDEKRQ